MAIVKARYTKSVSRIKAHLRYITHRPGREREKLSRQLFTYDYQTVDKHAAYKQFDLAPAGTYFYKIILSHDPTREDRLKDLDLRYLTDRAMHRVTSLIGQDAGTHVQFVAAIHDDHTDIRHVHTIVFLNRRFTRQALWLLRQSVTHDAVQQRRLLDRARTLPRIRDRTQARMLSHSGQARKQYRSYRAMQMQHGCSHCGYGQFSGIPSYRLFCPSCHQALTPEKTLRLELDRHL